jgi:hypothetical protein
MIPTHYRTSFQTLSHAFSDNAVCLLRCRERATDKPAYVICAVGRPSTDYEIVPFARLFDDNPYDLLAPPVRWTSHRPFADGGLI